MKQELLIRRIIAYFLDSIILSIILYPLLTPFRITISGITMMTLIAVFILMTYYLVFDYHYQQTPGKMLLNIKIQTLKRKQPTLQQYFLRELPKISSIFLLIDCLRLIKKHQRFTEHWSNTEITWEN